MAAGPPIVRDQDFSSLCSREWLFAVTMGKRDTCALENILANAECNPNEIFSKERETCCPLFMAVANGWIHGLKRLVANGADINLQFEIVECCHSKSRHIMTALMVAIDCHNYDLVRAVVDLGGDVTVSDLNTNINPLFIAAYTNQPCILAFLISTIEKKYKSKSLNSYRSPINKLINMSTVHIHSTPLKAAWANMGFRFDSLFYPVDPFTMVECDRLRQGKALNVMEILLQAGAHITDELPFVSATKNDTRMLCLFLQYGLNMNMISQPICPQGVQLPLDVQYLQSEFYLVSFYINAKQFKAVKLLLNAGCRLSIEDKNNLLFYGRQLQMQAESASYQNKENEQCLLKLLKQLNTVPSMLWLCRKGIRNQLQPCSDVTIKNLPLPKVLKSYISDIEDDFI